MATILTDPQRRAAQEELKLALLEAVLSLRGTQLASELTRLQPVELGKLIRAAALAWLEGVAVLAWPQPAPVPVPVVAARPGWSRVNPRRGPPTLS